MTYETPLIDAYAVYGAYLGSRIVHCIKQWYYLLFVWNCYVEAVDMLVLHPLPQPVERLHFVESIAGILEALCFKQLL